MGQRLHHAAHATHSGSTHRHFWFIFFLFHNYTFCSQEHTCNRSGIFQSYTSYLSRIYHTGSVQVFVNISTGIVTEVTFTFAYFLYYYCTFLTCIGNNLTKRFLDGTLDNLDTGCFVFIIALQTFQCFRSTDVSYATARNDTFFDSCTSSTQCIIHTVFLFLHFNFRSGTYIKNSYTT